MSDPQRRRLWLVAAPYALVVAAMVAGVAPIWCLGVGFAVPLAVRVVRAKTDVRPAAVEFAAVFVAQVVVGYLIKGIVR